MRKKIIVRPDGKKEVPENILKQCEDNPRRYAPTLRRLARYESLIARKSRRDGKWYFSDHNNLLRSPEQGLDEVAALEWLLEE
jgi:hypothetical protein